MNFLHFAHSEWYGKAHGRYLPCASLPELSNLFPGLDTKHHSSIPLPNGIETAHECHVRVKKGLDLLMAELDQKDLDCILLAGHAASAICAVRALLRDANYPVRCGTCSLSHLIRNQDGTWALEVNGSCDHLSQGEQRSWMFSGDVPDYEQDK
jgi:transcription factor C subunit 7